VKVNGRKLQGTENAEEGKRNLFIIITIITTIIIIITITCIAQIPDVSAVK